MTQRESVVLGYNLNQRPLTNNNIMNSSKTTSKPFRNSDVDFHDVFGGPPRRFSMHEVRPGIGGTSDDSDSDGDEDRDRPWSGLGKNKPVFGDEGANRRRLPSADFFADIFGGGASVHSTPKRLGRDSVFPGSSGSRDALSPLPPKTDQPFLTSQFSLSGKESKAMEVPTFGSSSRSQQQHKVKEGSLSNGIPYSLSSGASLSRFSSEAIQSSHHSSSLFAGDDDSPKSDKSEEVSKKTKKKSSENSTTSNNTGHFHFSIYRWKSKGVPLDIPLRGKASRSKDVAQLSESSNNKTTPLVESANSKSNGHTLRDYVSSSVIEDDDEPQKDLSSSDELSAEKEAQSAIKDEPEKETTKEFEPSKEEPQKPEVKSVHSLFYDDFEKGFSDMSNGSSKVSPAPVADYTKKTKKQDRKNTSSDGNSKVKGVQFSEGNGKNKVKGKVKDFVKMFNQEPSPKAQDARVFRSKSCKWNEKCAFEDEEKSNTSSKEEEKLQMPKANDDLKQSAKVHASEPCSDWPTEDSSKATVEETDDSFHDNFQIKDITQDENAKLESSTQKQEFQDIDAKIRKWTKGKEGNIRSLLSTLQYVLWAESGWRPVPLVDIIEGSAVKRAYQRALLCLHPDKLQQKGAASHQKYMAEKVFDILQEAWNYFNSLGAI